MSAIPMPDMMVRTSAKSRLISPGTRMRSEIPWTAWCRTESATLKASRSGVPRSTTDRSRWLGIVMSVSTTPRSSAIPCSACWARFLPSKVNGFVTTATVRIPSSLATAATMGAAPVPVPPPSPAVTKTMSAPSRMRAIFLRRPPPYLGVRAGAEAVGQTGAELELHGGRRGAKSLDVGIGDDELDPSEPGGHHPAHGVAAAAAEADDLDPRHLARILSGSFLFQLEDRSLRAR